MRKFIVCCLIFNLVFLAAAEDKHVDYVRNDGSVTRVTYSGPEGERTVKSENMSKEQYEERQKSDALWKLVVFVLKALLRGNR